MSGVATVLVCDDSALVRETLHRVLATVPGITRVVDATSGEEAPHRLVRLGEVWEKVRRSAVEADIFNLDRKALVFRIFADLAEAVR